MIAARNPVLGAVNGASSPDPVFALIKEHRAAYAAWKPLSDIWNSMLLSDPAYAAAEEAEQVPGERERAALAALVAARPTTLPGVLALAEYLPDAIRGTAIDEESEGERALRGIAVALRGLVLPADAPVVPDPVLAAIAAARQAQAETEAFIAETDEHPTLSAADREREGLLSTAQIGTDAAVWATVPTTQAGRLALVDYARFQVQVRTAADGMIDGAEVFIDEILTAVSAAIDAEAVLPAQYADEAQALALVGAIECAWAEDARRSRRDRADISPEAEARWGASVARRDALIDAAERLSAGTRAGRHAKALMLAWLDHVELWRASWPREHYAIDGRLAVDIEMALAEQSEARGRP